MVLALGMMHVIINENLIDADYVEKYTVGYEELKERVNQYPLEQVAEITGIPVDDIVTLTRVYQYSTSGNSSGSGSGEAGGRRSRCSQSAVYPRWSVHGGI